MLGLAAWAEPGARRIPLALLQRAARRSCALALPQVAGLQKMVQAQKKGKKK